jgi:hypothetical protein
MYSEYINKKALQGFGNFILGGQVIGILRYAGKEETVLQGKIDRLIDIDTCYGMEKTKVMIFPRQSSLLKIMIDQS